MQWISHQDRIFLYKLDRSPSPPSASIPHRLCGSTATIYEIIVVKFNIILYGKH